MTPEHPVVRGTAQNPDVFFQAREASNPFHQRRSRHRGHGDGRAGRAHRTPVRPGRLRRRPRRRAGGRAHGIGWRQRWRRPSRRSWPRARRSAWFGSGCSSRSRPSGSSPRCRRRSGRSPCSIAPRSPARWASRSTCSVVAALAEHFDAEDGDSPVFDRRPRVIGGRYGLSSKELTPAMVKPIFDELAAPRPEAALHRRHRRRRHPPEPAGRRRVRRAPPRRTRSQAMFFGLGSDGTVGANKASVKIIGEHTDLLRAGLLRLRLQEVGLGDRVAPAVRARADPLHLPHRRRRLRRLPPVRSARDDEGARPRPSGRHLPAQQPLRTRPGVGPAAHRGAAPARRQARSSCGSSTPAAWPARPGWAAASTPSCSPASSISPACCPPTRRSPQIKRSVEAAYGNRGSVLVERNFAAIDRSLAELHRVVDPDGGDEPSDRRRCGSPTTPPTS